MSTHSSLITNVTVQVDSWCQRLKSSRMKDSLHSTIKLIQAFNSPIICSYLMSQRIKQFEMNTFTTLLRSVMEAAEVIYRKILLTNLERVSREESIISTLNFEQDRERRLYEGSMKVMEVGLRYAQRTHLVKDSFQELRAQNRQFLTPRKQEEVDEDIELMKFFQGIRRYQDEEEEVAKRALEKLRIHKDKVVGNVQLMKGFRVSEFAQVVGTGLRRSKEILFNQFRRTVKTQGFVRLLQNKRLSNQADSFYLIKKSRSRYILHSICEYLANKSRKNQILSIITSLKTFKTRYSNIHRGSKIIERISKQRLLDYFRTIDCVSKSKNPRILKLAASFLLGATQYRLKTLRRAVKTWSLNVGSKKKPFIKLFCRKMHEKLKFCLTQFRENMIQKRAAKLSLKMKGRILSAVVKHEKVVDLRKAFMCWYTRSNKALIKDKMVDILTYASINKLTAFVRLKNLIADKKYGKVTAKMRLFLMILTEKSHKFVNFAIKQKFTTWRKKTLDKRIISRMIDCFQRASLHINEANVKKGFISISKLYKQSKIKKKFFLIIFKNVFSDVKKCVSRWKKLPDVRRVNKEAGMRKAIKIVAKATTQNKIAAWSEFTKQYESGYVKKVNLLKKAFTMDSHYMQKFMYRWKSVVSYSKFQLKSLQQKKEISLKTISQLWKDNRSFQIRSIISRFRNNMLKKNILKNYFKKVNVTANKNISIMITKMRSLLFENKDKQLKALMFERTLSDLFKRRCRAPLDTLVLDQFQGKQKKLWLARRFVNKLNDKLSNSLSLWQVFSQSQKGTQQNLQTLRFITNLTDTFSNVCLKNMLQDTKGSNKKRQALKRLCETQNTRFIGLIKRWRDLSKLKSAQKICLQNMVRTFKQLRLAQIKPIIKIFKVGIVINRFLSKIQTTKAGAVYKAIQIWKELPIPRDINKILNANKFVQVLHKFVLVKLSILMSAMKADGKEGEYSKRKCLNKMLEKVGDIRKRKFTFWRLTIQKNRQQLQCRSLIHTFESLFETYKSNLQLVLENPAQWLLKEKAFLKLSKNIKNWKADTLNRWRLIARNMTFNIKITNEKKIQCTKVLQDAVNSTRFKALRQVIAKFHKNSRIMKMQNNFFQRLMDTQFGKVIKAINVWKNLPQLKNRELIARATKFQSGLQKFLWENLKSTYKSMKNLYEDGLVKKKDSIRTLIHKCSKGISRYFEDWKNDTRRNKFFMICKKTEKTMVTLNSHIADSLGKMFEIGRKAKIVKALSKIIPQKNHLTYFRRWRLTFKLDKQSKRAELTHKFLQFMNIVIKANSLPVFSLQTPTIMSKKRNAVRRLIANQERVQRDTLRILHLRNQQYKRAQIEQQRRLSRIMFLVRYIQSICMNPGLVAIINQFKRNAHRAKKLEKLLGVMVAHANQRTTKAISIWKELPDLRLIERNKRMLKTITKALQGVMSVLRQNFQCFKQYLKQGEYRKRSAALLIVNTSKSKVGKLYGRWNQATRVHKTITICRKSEYFFQQLQHVYCANLSVIFENPRDLFLKEKYLNKLVDNHVNMIKESFTRWVSFSRQSKISSQLTSQRKILMINNINNFLTNKNLVQIKKIVHMFYLNWKIKQAQTNFIKKLLMTKGGRVMEAVRIWKNLPEPRQLQKVKKAHKFFNALHELVERNYALAFKPIKSDSQQADIFKKRAILQLLNTTSSGIRKYYSRWMDTTKRVHLLRTCKVTHDMIVSLTHVACSNLQILFQDEHARKLKQKYIQMLIDNTEGRMKHCFGHWVQVVRVERLQKSIENSKKRQMIAMIEHAIGDQRRTKLKQIVKKFYLHFKIGEIGRNFFRRLLQTKSGMVINAVHVWKSLPNPHFSDNKIKILKFLRGLENYCERPFRASFQICKLARIIGEGKQKMCIHKLLRKCMSTEQRKFVHWKNITKELALLEKSKLMASFFESNFGILSKTIHINLIQPASSELQKKKDICRRMINNSNNIQAQAFMRWVQAFRNDTIRSQSQKNSIKQKLLALVGAWNSVRTVDIKIIVGNFRKLLEKRAALIRYFQIMNSNRLQSIRNGFISWLRIDDLSKKKHAKQMLAIQFAQGLEKFGKSRLKTFFLTVQEEFKQSIVLNKFIATEGLFTALTDVYKTNLLIMLRNPRQTALMVKSLNRFVENTMGKLRGALTKWHSDTKHLQIVTKLGSEKKKMMIILLKKLIQEREAEGIPRIIKAFYKNYKISEIQKKVLKKILNCKAGKVAQYYLEWKNLPDNSAKILRRRVSVFERGLDKFYLSRMKSSFECFKSAIYIGEEKKRHAVRKIVLMTMSDSNRLFSKWRRLNTQTNILNRSQKLQNAFGRLTDISRKHLQGIFIRQGGSSKIEAIRKLMNNNSHILYDGFQIWKTWNMNIKQQKAKQILERMMQIVSGEKVYVESFRILKKQREMNVLRNYINSLWRWKTSNIEAQYYTKFINIFRQSEELLSFSRIMNSKFNAIYHNVFNKLKSKGTKGPAYQTAVVAKYLTKRVSSYFNQFRKNLKQKEVQFWKKRFQSSIKGISIVNAFEKAQRKFTFYTVKIWREKANKKSAKINSTKKFETIFGRIYRNHWCKLKDSIKTRILSSAIDLIQQIISSRKSSALQMIKISCAFEKFVRVFKSYQNQNVFASFDQIKAKAVKQAKTSQLLRNLNKLIIGNQTATIQKVIESFKSQSRRLSRLKTVLCLLERIQEQSRFEAFTKLRQILRNKKLLRKFKSLHLISHIDQKLDTKMVHKYFNIWRETRKLENPWMKRCITLFATKSPINTSLAVSLWRLKQGNQP